MKHITFLIVLTVLFFCSCNTTKSEITTEMAYEGVSTYCHSAYDWSMAEANPSMMYVEMGEEYATSNTGWVVLRQPKKSVACAIKQIQFRYNNKC